MTEQGHVQSGPDACSSPLVWSALDLLEEGVGVFDENLHLVYCNAPFRDLRDYPDRVCRPGAHISELYRHNAARGDYETDDVEGEVERRTARASTGEAYGFDHMLSDDTSSARVPQAHTREVGSSSPTRTSRRSVVPRRRFAAERPAQHPGCRNHHRGHLRVEH